nr:facilitated trehalose transporter Tret1-like [Penaeus vannamei]
MTRDTMESIPPSRIQQYVTTASATMGALALGSVIGFTTHCVAQLIAESPPNSNSDLRITPPEASWFASSANLGAVVGGLIGGLAANHIGRRGTLLAVAPPFIAGWLMIALAYNFALLIAGRVLTGVCMGAVCSVAPPYIGEFASADIRGTLGSCFQVMLTTGILYAFFLGAVVGNWRIQALLCMLPPGLLLVSMYFAKESPIFLLAKGKDEEAEKSLQFFRGKNYNIQEELKVLKESIEDAQRNSFSLKDLKQSYVLKPLLISLSLMFFQQTTGVPAVMFNLTTVFRASGSALSDDMSVIIIGIVQVLATGGAGSGNGGFSFANRTSSPLPDQRGAPVSAIGVIPLVLLVVFISAFSVGLGPVPWLMMGELFPSNARETAASLSTACNWISAFLITLIFYPMTTSLGEHGTYWVFGCICVLALAFSASVVPETKGRTLLQISAYFGAPDGAGDTGEVLIACSEVKFSLQCCLLPFFPNIPQKKELLMEQLPCRDYYHDVEVDAERT